MFSIAGIDLLEEELLDHERTLLEILLQDKATKKNIIWATDDYAELGEQYSFKKEILPELVSKPWTDEELYKKYELTEDEIAFVESTISVME